MCMQRVTHTATASNKICNWFCPRFGTFLLEAEAGLSRLFNWLPTELIWEDLDPLLKTLYGDSLLLIWLINLLRKPVNRCPPIGCSSCLNCLRKTTIKDALVWSTNKFQSLFAVATDLRHYLLSLVTDYTGLELQAYDQLGLLLCLYHVVLCVWICYLQTIKYNTTKTNQLIN